MAAYIKSDKLFLKNTVLPVPHHDQLDCLPPNDELNQGLVTREKDNQLVGINQLVPKKNGHEETP